MFQKLIEKILGSFKQKEAFPFPTSRPEDSLKKEPVLDPISKQTSQPDSVNNQITDSVTIVSEPVVETQVVEEPIKKKKTTKQNGSKATKRKSKQ